MNIRSSPYDYPKQCITDLEAAMVAVLTNYTYLNKVTAANVKEWRIRLKVLEELNILSKMPESFNIGEMLGFISQAREIRSTEYWCKHIKEVFSIDTSVANIHALTTDSEFRLTYNKLIYRRGT